MPKTQRTLRPVEVDYICDKCKEGHYRPTGIKLTSMPPKFPHKCTKCNDTKTFREKYPTIRYM